ncbi:MAG: M56 family metallopeptidase [bacterium]|nr:M56 family metallopeptidase [bacterium]
MTKHRIYLIVLGVISIGVAILLVSVCQKYLPFLFHSTIYYCQNIIRTVSIQLLPTIASKPLFISFLAVLGFIGFRLFSLAVQFLKERKQFQQAIIPYGELKKTAQKLGIINQVRMIRNHKPLAICFGIFQPKIYISTGLLKIVNAGELRAILTHEKYHLNSRDNLVMLMASVVQSLFPFFPIIKDFIKHYRIQRELEADTHAVTGHNDNKHLISALEKLIRNEPQYAFIGSSGLGVFDTLETRIRYLVYKTGYQPKVSIINSAISGIALFLLLFLSLVPVQATELHDRWGDALMTCVSSNKCSASCKNNISY